MAPTLKCLEEIMKVSIPLFDCLGVSFIFLISLNSAADSVCSRGHLTPFWGGGEHIYLADLGVVKACEEVGATDCPLTKRIPRNDGKFLYSYGEISTLGDFYATAEEIYNENGDNISEKQLGNIFSCMNNQRESFEKQKEIPGVELPECGMVYKDNAKNMVELVRTNYAHFGWNNMVTYVSYHQKALDMAIKAHSLQNSNPSLAQKTLQNALFINGFADHFLTDAFSSGHIRVPRKQLKEWAEKNMAGFFKADKGNIISLAFHDRESKDRNGNEIGLTVENSLGQKWKAQSDGKLNECTADDELPIANPINAVYHSVREVLYAYKSGSVSNGKFEATLLVPFPVDGDSFSSRYPVDDNLDETVVWLRSDLMFPLNIILTHENVKTFLKSLPEIMQIFRQEVQGEAGRSVELSERLPSKYIEAYSHIH